MPRSPRLSVLVCLFLFATSIARSDDRKQIYTVLVEGPSVGEQLAADARAKSDTAVREIGQEVRERQLQLMPSFAETGAEVLDSVHNVLNAVFVRATEAQADQIRQVAGVAGVVPARPIRLHSNAAGQVVRLPEARAIAGGDVSAGLGVKIGVIDTGIDHTHPAFDDAGFSMPPGFPKGFPEDQAFTTKKIIAARSYVHLLNSDNPQFSNPDDETPRDHVGHGTAVAMIAAGRAIDSPVGPLVGAAPGAQIGNYKIFGSPDVRDFSSDAALVAAIDDAVSDGMDVLTISSGVIEQYPWDETGATCGRADNELCDPAAFATQVAIEDFGVIIVASAGNAGDSGWSGFVNQPFERTYPTLTSISSPASAPDVIAVGATSNSRYFVQSVQYDGTTVDALAGTGPELTAPLTATAKDAITAGDQFACSAFNGGDFAGMIAVVDDGECDVEFKVAFAARAGAVGVVLVNFEGRDFPERVSGLETADIPLYTIGYSDGSALINQLAITSVTITLDPTLIELPSLSGDIALTSSRGPSLGGEVKPEVVAPGLDIFAAAQRLDSNGRLHGSNGFIVADGTSFSTPFVAGTAALVRQRRPAASVAEIRSAVINTANPEIFDGSSAASVFAKGAGQLDAQAAVQSPILTEPATLGFGSLTGFSLPIQRTLTVKNLANQTHTLTAQVVVGFAAPSAAIEIDGLQTTAFQISAGQQHDLAVRLTGTVPGPGIYEGYILITSNLGTPDLVVPYAFTVGDGIGQTGIAIAGTGVIGTVDELHPELLIFRLVDAFGEPVGGTPVDFGILEGGGRFSTDEQGFELRDGFTDIYGGAAASVIMGPSAGFQDFVADVDGISIPFLNEARWKPVIGGIVNGAGFKSGPVAPGSIISVFGVDLAEFLGGASSVPLPIALKHVSFSFDFPETGLSAPAAFFYSSPGQLNMQVPWEFQGHNFAIVKVRIGDTVSETFVLDLRDAAPGVFDFDYQGQLLGVATHADGSVITPANPAQRGETIIVYGTGFGPVDTPQATGAAAPEDGTLVRTTSIPVASLGGVSASVAFSGLAPGFAGLNQINIRIPNSAGSGPQTLKFTTGGMASNEVTIWVE